MHIPDGFINPHVSYGLMGAAAAVLGFCFSKVKETLTSIVKQPALATVGKKVGNLSLKGRRALTKLGEKKLYQMGMVASLIFAAQMFNFPINQGTSGHLIGGTLAVILLGPFAGTLTVAAVVMIQALFFADGGLIVMGANLINMAFLAAFVSYYIYGALKKRLPSWFSIGFTAWFSVILAATAASFEISTGAFYSLSTLLKNMLSVHVIIGLAEALITIALIKLLSNLNFMAGEENE